MVGGVGMMFCGGKWIFWDHLLAFVWHGGIFFIFYIDEPEKNPNQPQSPEAVLAVFWQYSEQSQSSLRHMHL